MHANIPKLMVLIHSEFVLRMFLRRCTSGKVEEPQTPSPRRTELIRKLGNPKSNTSKSKNGKKNDGSSSAASHSSGIEKLLWRNRKPFRRQARKRVEFESFSPFFNVHN